MRVRFGRQMGFLGVLAACVFGFGARRPVLASASHDAKATGGELFATRGCVQCHGDDGGGTDRAPALRDLRKKLSADRIREQIVHGGQAMPAFGDSLQPDEVDALVVFLRAKTWVMPLKAPQSPKLAVGAGTDNPGI